MAFTGADIHPGDHITWTPGQPPRQPYDQSRNGPLLALYVALRALRPDEVTSMGLTASEDWFWAIAATGLAPPEAVPASMVYSIGSPARVDAEGLLEYFGS